MPTVTGTPPEPEPEPKQPETLRNAPQLTKLKEPYKSTSTTKTPPEKPLKLIIIF